MELTTKDWKEFRIGDLFDQIGKTAVKKPFDKRNTPEGEFIIPALSSKIDNNSFGFYVREEDHLLINRLCLSITLNGDAGKVYVQNKDFAIAQDAYAIYLKDDFNILNNEAIYLFLATIMEKVLIPKYGYTNKATWNKVKKETLLLPSKNDEPDWDFMEEFIKGIEEKYILNVDKYNQENIDKALSVTGLTTADLNGNLEVKPADRYEEFRVGDLFDKVEVGYKSSENFEKEISISNVKTDEFNLPLINAKDGNNGIMYYGKIEDWSYVDNSIDIISDGAVSTGNVYYQKQNTSVLYNAYLIKLKANYEKYNFREVLLYLTTKLQKQLKEIYHYQNKAGWNKVKNEKILLPAIDEDTPDFDYMEKAIYIY